MPSAPLYSDEFQAKTVTGSTLLVGSTCRTSGVSRRETRSWPFSRTARFSSQLPSWNELTRVTGNGREGVEVTVDLETRMAKTGRPQANNEFCILERLKRKTEWMERCSLCSS